MISGSAPIWKHHQLPPATMTVRVFDFLLSESSESSGTNASQYPQQRPKSNLRCFSPEPKTTNARNHKRPENDYSIWQRGARSMRLSPKVPRDQLFPGSSYLHIAIFSATHCFNPQVTCEPSWWNHRAISPELLSGLDPAAIPGNKTKAPINTRGHSSSFKWSITEKK